MKYRRKYHHSLKNRLPVGGWIKRFYYHPNCFRRTTFDRIVEQYYYEASIGYYNENEA